MEVIRVVSDLFFSAKVAEVCRALAIDCFVAKSRERMEALLAENPEALVMVDLGLQGGQGPALAGLAVTKVGAGRVYAFYSHVAEELLAAASAAGVTKTYTRSSFFDQLPSILSHAKPEHEQAERQS